MALHTAAPQTAPEAMRKASGPAFNRLEVKGSLSATSSLIANSVIRREARPEIIVENGEFARGIHSCFVAHAIMAGATIGRNPAIAPIPIANERV
jgi:hypothetical protein